MVAPCTVNLETLSRAIVAFTHIHLIGGKIIYSGTSDKGPSEIGTASFFCGDMYTVEPLFKDNPEMRTPL